MEGAEFKEKKRPVFHKETNWPLYRFKGLEGF